MQDKQSVYDKDGFFDLYQKLRSNPNSLNEIVEKPTMLGLVGGVSGKRILDLGRLRIFRLQPCRRFRIATAFTLNRRAFRIVNQAV